MSHYFKLSAWVRLLSVDLKSKEESVANESSNEDKYYLFVLTATLEGRLKLSVFCFKSH